MPETPPPVNGVPVTRVTVVAPGAVTALFVTSNPMPPNVSMLLTVFVFAFATGPEPSVRVTATLPITPTPLPASVSVADGPRVSVWAPVLSVPAETVADVATVTSLFKEIPLVFDVERLLKLETDDGTE